MARQLHLAFLATAVLAGTASAIRTNVEGIKESSEPPKKEVEAGLEAAEGHVAQKERETAAALETATASVATAQKAMTDALMSHDTAATKVAYEAFEKAIAAKAAAEAASSGAKELREMVRTHNALVDRFFDSVAQFLQTQAQKDESRQIADAKHLEEARQAAQVRFEKDSRLEVAGMKALLVIFDQLTESAQGIKVKDDSLGSPGVHAAVSEGLHKVKQWSNGETHQVCAKYAQSTNPIVVAVREKVPQKDGQYDCHALIDALALEYPVQE